MSIEEIIAADDSSDGEETLTRIEPGKKKQYDLSKNEPQALEYGVFGRGIIPIGDAITCEVQSQVYIGLKNSPEQNLEMRYMEEKI